MNVCKLSLLFSVGIILSACGGGGGGNKNPQTSTPAISSMSSTPVSSLNSSAVSTSSQTTSSSAPVAAFSLDKTEVNFKAAITDPKPESVDVKVISTNPNLVYFRVIANSAPFLDVTFITTLNNEHTITLPPLAPKDLAPGKHSGKVYVWACKDEACLDVYEGGAVSVTVNYEVTAPTFTINKNQVTFNIIENQSPLPSETLLLTLSEPVNHSGGFFTYGSFPDWLTFSSSVSGLNGTVELGVGQNLAAGTYTTTISSFLLEVPLQRRIDITVNVASGSSSSGSSSSVSTDCGGNLFINSACASQWRSASIFEQHKIDLTYEIIFDAPSGKMITLSTVDSGDSSHNEVLDVHYNGNTSYNAQIGIDAVDYTNGANMGDYLNGKLVFDVKVISKGDANANLFVKVECKWPCQSNLHEVNVASLDTWTTIEIPIADLVEDGLNIERVSNGFIIFPEWNAQSNSHFQVDNIRWVK